MTFLLPSGIKGLNIFASSSYFSYSLDVLIKCPEKVTPPFIINYKEQWLSQGNNGSPRKYYTFMRGQYVLAYKTFVKVLLWNTNSQDIRHFSQFLSYFESFLMAVKIAYNVEINRIEYFLRKKQCPYEFKGLFVCVLNLFRVLSMLSYW